MRRAVSDPDSYIAATQLGITMASLGLGWIGEPAHRRVRPARRHVPADRTSPNATAHSIAVAIAFAIVTALHITLGELAPKTIALERAERPRCCVVKPTELFMKVFWPFIRLLNGMGRGDRAACSACSGPGGHALVHSEEELKMLVTASQEAGVLEEAGRADAPPRLRLRGPDGRPGDGAAHRARGRARPTPRATTLLRRHQRVPATPTLPVYRDDLDNVIGILHAIDVVKAIAAGQRDVSAGAIARETLTVPETMAADDLLASLRQRGVREAMVIDEYGGTAGLVTFEWLMERIVGARPGTGTTVRTRTARRTSTD